MLMVTMLEGRGQLTLPNTNGATLYSTTYHHGPPRLLVNTSVEQKRFRISWSLAQTFISTQEVILELPQSFDGESRWCRSSHGNGEGARVDCKSIDRVW